MLKVDISFLTEVQYLQGRPQPAFTCQNSKTETLRTRCDICSKLAIKTPEQRQLRRSDVFIVNFEHISHLALVFLLLTLNKYLPAGTK